MRANSDIPEHPLPVDEPAHDVGVGDESVLPSVSVRQYQCAVCVPVTDRGEKDEGEVEKEKER